MNVLAQDQRTGFGLLHAACKGGQVELLDKLLTWDLQIPTDMGLSPLSSSWHRSHDDGSFAPYAPCPEQHCKLVSHSEHQSTAYRLEP